MAVEAAAEDKNLLKKILEGFCVFSLGGVVILLALQVFSRHLLKGAFPWSAEMATWLFVWTSFMGSVLVYMDKKHVVIDFLISFLPDKLTKAIDFCLQALLISFLVLLTVKGFEVVRFVADETAVSLDLSTAFLFVALPVSSLLMICWSIYSWIVRS